MEITMKIELMIYVYIAICVSMIAFNIVYVFILKSKNKRLISGSKFFSKEIYAQFQDLYNGKEVSREHKNMLFKKLKKTYNLTAFDKAMEMLYNDDKQTSIKYIKSICPVFNDLAIDYRKRNAIICAYFPYIVAKYKLLENDDNNSLLESMFELLGSNELYARENALSAIYTLGDTELAIRALKKIDKNLSFHHPKLLCDGLMDFSGDRDKLGSSLIEILSTFSEKMQLNILNFLRFAGVRNDGKMLKILCDDGIDQELRFSAIRYFEKFYNEEAKEIIKEFAKGIKHLPWQYQAIATSALKTYPDEETDAILKKNLSSSNWYIRLNSAKVCEELGYTYTELINIFDGDDRYAREILRYRLDRREAEEKAVLK